MNVSDPTVKEYWVAARRRAWRQRIDEAARHEGYRVVDVTFDEYGSPTEIRYEPALDKKEKSKK